MAVSGQKHLIFRAKIAMSRDLFPLQFEEDTVMLNRARFAPILTDFERLYGMGFPKDSIVTGRYHAGQLMKVNRSAWHDAERQMALHRRLSPQYVAICHLVAQKARTEVCP